MLCPIDQTTLVMTERQGIEIDYCPTCRGVWLDRGELDKLVERSVSAAAPPPPPASAYSRPPTDRDVHRGYREGGEGGEGGEYGGHYGKHRRKSLLGDIFDF